MTSRRRDMQVPEPPPYRQVKPVRPAWMRPMAPILAYRAYLRREPERIAWDLLHALVWEIYLHLERLGVNALLPDAESRTVYSKGNQIDTRGTVDVDRSKVSWIEVSLSVPKSDGNTRRSIPQPKIVLVVQDPWVGPKHPRVEVRPEQALRETPAGKAVDVHWEGEDGGSGLARSLTKDSTILQGISTARTAKTGAHVADVTIEARPDYEGWVISTPWMPEEMTIRRWSAYEKIAGYLRDSSKPRS
jgi:hypothetical protein